MFDKKFVRVEALALVRALALQKEAGFEGLYLCNSSLSSEGGSAAAEANCGGTFQDVESEEKTIEVSVLPPGHLGLKHEIEAFKRHDPYDILNQDQYLVRQYQFYFNDPDKAHTFSLYVVVNYRKKTKKDDWEVMCESAWAINEKGEQAHDPMVWHDKR